MGRKAIWPPKVYPHPASGRDRCRYGGKDYYLGPSGSAESRREYARLVTEWEKVRAAAEAPAGLTVAQAVLLWYADAAGDGEPPLEVVNCRGALAPVLALYAALPAAQFAGPQLRAVQAEMIRRGWARSFINRSVVRVRTVWRWAEEAGHVPGGAWNALRAVKPLNRPRPGVKESPRVRPSDWTSVARAAYLGARPGLRLHVLLGWFSGARPSELSGLTKRMIDASGPVWTADLERHKTAWRGHRRTLYFGPECQELLAPRLAEIGDDDLVCANDRGGAWDRRTLRQALHRACRRAGVPEVNPYSYRHSYASRVAKSHGVNVARALLGHRSADMTLHYSQEADAMIAEEAARKVA